MLPYSVISYSPPLLYFFTQCPTFTLSSRFCLFVFPLYACLYPLLPFLSVSFLSICLSFFTFLVLSFVLFIQCPLSVCLSSFLHVCLCSCPLLLFRIFFLLSPFLFFNLSVPFFLKPPLHHFLPF